MRLFTDIGGRHFDLDDPKTYTHLPQNLTEVIDRLYREIGYATVYFNRHDFLMSKCGKAQVERVAQVVAELSKNFGQDKPLQFWQEQLFIFLDEIENLC